MNDVTSNQWIQRLQRSLHLSRSKPEAKFFQLASVTPEGRPDNRTLVFRGFDDATGSLLAITDTRSEKLAQLLANPHVSVAWYFVRSREQYRINGKINIRIDDRTELACIDTTAYPMIEHCSLQSFWNTLSEATRQQFYWPHPGQPVCDAAIADADMTVLSKFFSVLCIYPDEVQYLDLKAAPQLREIHTLEQGRWSVKTVNP